ncbi:MAG: CBS domain-containing protein [Verrucomicrobia bacterium]|nr:CBS domain-containing protein [Verrucomicrobiota bacterium]
MEIVGTISEILNTKGNQVWSVSPDTTVFDSLKVMGEKNIGALLVMEGGRLVGVVSERDYTRKIALFGRNSRSTRVREILTSVMISVTPKHTVQECMELMTTHRVRHLPVLEEDRVVGIVSIGDLVNWIINAQRTALDQLQNYITGQYHV